MMTWHRVHHTPDTAFTEYSIPPRLCVFPRFSWLLVDPWMQFHLWRTSSQDRLASASSPCRLKSNIRLSYSPGCELRISWIESQLQARRPSTAPKSSSTLAQSRPPSASPNTQNYGFQVLKITDSMCISPHSLDCGLILHLHTHSITASKCISEFSRSRPLRASFSSLNLGVPLHLQTHSITASECISEFILSWSPGAPRIAVNHGVLPVQIYCVYIVR